MSFFLVLSGTLFGIVSLGHPFWDWLSEKRLKPKNRRTPEAKVGALRSGSNFSASGGGLGAGAWARGGLLGASWFAWLLGWLVGWLLARLLGHLLILHLSGFMQNRTGPIKIRDGKNNEQRTCLCRRIKWLCFPNVRSPMRAQPPSASFRRSWIVRQAPLLLISMFLGSSPCMCSLLPTLLDKWLSKAKVAQARGTAAPAQTTHPRRIHPNQDTPLS